MYTKVCVTVRSYARLFFSMFKSTKSILALFLLLTAVTLACGPSSLIPGQATAIPPTPTPSGDVLVYHKLSPTYVANLNPGDKVAGARIEYAGKTEDGGYEVYIDGLQSIKRPGDAFNWSGIIAPGTHGQFNLRLGTDILGQLSAAGSATVAILNPEPFPLDAIPNSPDGLRLSNILVEYTVPVGSQIPGTNLMYLGTTQEGGVNVAEISGGSQRPYYAFGESVVWRGKLRDNVFAENDLRVGSFDENNLFIGGLVELYIEQNRPPATE